MLVGVDGRQKSARVPGGAGAFSMSERPVCVFLRLRLFTDAVCKSRGLFIFSALSFRLRAFLAVHHAPYLAHIWDAPLA